MAKRKPSTAPAGETESTEEQSADAAIEIETAAAEAPAAPAASETAASDTPPATDPAPSAEPAAAPESPPPAPPASAEMPAFVVGSAVDDLTPFVPASDLPTLTDTTQETLEKQAEVKQPEAPRLDRVLKRLSTTLNEPLPWDTAQMSSHTVFLHGPAIELMTRLHLAIVADGIPVNSQGDNVQFLLEELDKSLRGAF